MSTNITVIKNGDKGIEAFEPAKIKAAIEKSATRVGVELSDTQKDRVVEIVEDIIASKALNQVTVEQLHSFVEMALDDASPVTAKSYRQYRDFKAQFAKMMNRVANFAETVMYRGDRENANKDSSLVSTQNALIASEFGKEMYINQFLTAIERSAEAKGFIYLHDKDKRLFTINCCLFLMGVLLKNGFEMGNDWYNEPCTLDVAFDVISDIVLSAASQQYGGFTIPQIDFLLEPYAKKTYEKTYKKRMKEYKELGVDIEKAKQKAEEAAMEQVEYEFRQGFQGWEMKFNTVGSSRGDYPFVTVTSGLNTSRFGVLCNVTMFKVHMEGQGAPGKKRPVLFPKYVYLYDKETNGSGPVYEAAFECSSKTMYPDWLSLSGEGYVPSMYKKYKKVVSPMGCRAFLSPYYERGGFEPADENDVPVFEGRFNAGAISLNLPLIYLDAKARGVDFMKELDYYLEMIRQLHIKTKAFLGEKRASINPLGFTQGGFYGGNLRPEQKLKESKKLMEATTYSFGITALNELQQAYNGKSIAEDGEFALEVLQHINRKVNEYKQADHILYAIYGTPAESLCGKQIKQMREYVRENMEQLEAAGYTVRHTGDGDYVIDGVCDKEYVSNSFHCHVTEDITPIQKQDSENRFWNLCNGGKIQYIRYPLGYNKKAMRTLIDRAMDLGFYEGENLALNYCDDCGYEQIDMADVCPKCGSRNITKIDRMNGYLAFSRVHGATRLNDAKMAEIKDRKSM